MISLIIPVFNAERFLRQCLDSVKSQTFKDFEAILVDDGSTDSSGLICDEYSVSDNRFHVIHQVNQGVSSARNKGIEAAQGEYVYFADSDDSLRPETLEHLYAAIRQGDYDIAASGFSIVKDGVEVDKCIIPGGKPIVYSSDEALSKLLKDEDLVFFVCWNKLITKTLVDEVKFENINQEDYLFCASLYLRLRSLIYLNESLYMYIDRPSSLSKEFSYIGPHQTVAVLVRLSEEIPKERKVSRALLLNRLMRGLRTSSYLISNAESLSHNEKEAYLETCKTLYKTHKKEFFFHPAISLKDKIKMVVWKIFPKLLSKYFDLSRLWK